MIFNIEEDVEIQSAEFVLKVWQKLSIMYFESVEIPWDLSQGGGAPLAVLWYKSYIIKGKVQTLIFLKTVLKKYFAYYQYYL